MSEREELNECVLSDVMEEALEELNQTLRTNPKRVGRGVRNYIERINRPRLTLIQGGRNGES